MADIKYNVEYVVTFVESKIEKNNLDIFRLLISNVMENQAIIANSILSLNCLENISVIFLFYCYTEIGLSELSLIKLFNVPTIISRVHRRETIFIFVHFLQSLILFMFQK